MDKDIEKLQSLLSKRSVPEPDESAKNKAISAGLQEFRALKEKNAFSTQGMGQAKRPMDVTSLTAFLRRISMKKLYVVTGGLSAAAIATVLLSSTHLYTEVIPVPVSKTQTLATPQPVTQQTPQAITPAEESKQEPVIAVMPPISAPQTTAVDVKAVPLPENAPAKQGKDSSVSQDRERDDNTTPAFSPHNAGAVDALSKNKESKKATTSELRAAPSVSAQGRMMAEGVVSPQDLAQTSYYHDEGRDKFTDIKINPVKQVKDEPVSTFSIDVDTASYSFVRRMLNSGVMPQQDAVRIEEMVNYFTYDYPLPESKTEPFKPTVAVYPAPWNAQAKLVHIGIKGFDVVPTEKPRANLVFLLDTSGSMNEPDKLPLLKQSLRMLVNELQPKDTVAIVVYAGSAGTVLEPTSDKQKILAALDNLEAGGSTAGGEGIKLAYTLAQTNFDKSALNRVILATDGDFNVGITDTNELKSYIEQKRNTGVFLSVLGFGQGNYNDELMQALAQNGNGNAAYIDSANEARKVLVNEMGSTLFTIAKDVKIQVEFNPDTVSEYRLIGYESRMLNREDFNNDKVDAGDVGSGHAVTAIYQITPKGASGSIDPLRYQTEAAKSSDSNNGNEYAFLKIRYKLPNESESKLLTRPITPSDDVKDAASVKNDLGFAAAVAGFGQLVSNSAYSGSWSYDDVIALAQSTKGKDEFGYRSEFIQLVRTAKSLAGNTAKPNSAMVE